MFNKLKSFYYTKLARYKILRLIKKNTYMAYTIGREICGIYNLIFLKTKENDLFNYMNIYSLFYNNEAYKDFQLLSILNQYIDYEILFSKLNIDVLQLNINILSAYLRGYYINELSMNSINISNKNEINWLVLYDYHYHYLLYLYNYFSNIYSTSYMRIELNNDTDLYSFNSFTDELTYKLIFLKKNTDFIDTIEMILSFLYKNIDSKIDLHNEEDIFVYETYKAYLKYD